MLERTSARLLSEKRRVRIPPGLLRAAFEGDVGGDLAAADGALHAHVSVHAVHAVGRLVRPVDDDVPLRAAALVDRQRALLPALREDPEPRLVAALDDAQA